MKHHRAKAPFEAVLLARKWWPRCSLGSKCLSDFVNGYYEPKELEQDWDKPRPKIVNKETMRGWLDDTRATR